MHEWDIIKYVPPLDISPYPICRLVLEDGVIVDQELVFKGEYEYHDKTLTTYTFPNFVGKIKWALEKWMRKDMLYERERPKTRYWVMKDMCEVK